MAKRKRVRAVKGMGSVRFVLKKNLYEARVSYRDAQGSRRSKSSYHRDEIKANDALTELRTKYGSGPVDETTLSGHMTKWIGRRSGKRGEWSSATLRGYTSNVSSIRYVGDLAENAFTKIAKSKLTALTVADVSSFMDDLKAAGRPVAARASILRTLTTIINDAMRLELVGRNVALSVNKPSAAKRPQRILDLEEATRFLDQAKGSPYFALFVLAITTGARQGELFALRWQNIDLERGQILIDATLGFDDDDKLVSKNPKTKGSVRQLDIPKMAVAALEKHPRTTSDYVFTDSLGGPLRKDNFVFRVFKPLLVAAGLPDVRFHSLRHTANSVLIAQGATIHAVQERGGWSSPRMPLETYGHLLPTAKARAADLVEKAFAPKRKRQAKEGPPR